MKVLLVGMDGAHTGAFQREWTPFVSSLLEKGKQLNIVNDLLSRGWLEIATGQHASVTGAMYDKPKVDGSLEWSLEFCIHDIPGFGETVKPLWQALNERGHSVGIMNLPTTFPAPSVNGFFVSGGGGGAPVTQAATKELCYPQEISGELNQMGYIVDDRLYQLVVDKKLVSPGEIFTQLAHKNRKRTECFLALNKRFDVDFGFVVYKTSSVLAETILNTEWVRRDGTGNQQDENLELAIRKYYEAFDGEIRALHEAYPGAEIVFVSDHGTIGRKYSVNPNVFLQEKGFQTVGAKKALLKTLVGKLKEIIPFSVKAYLKKTSVMKAKNVGLINFDLATTKAFCKTQGDWSHGIYINDSVRFGGIVGDDFDTVKSEIIDLLNSDPLIKKHGLRAYSTGDKRTFFPDIAIELPNGFLTTDKSKVFIEEFKVPQSSGALGSIMKGDILSLKSHTPLAVFSNVFLDEVGEESGDLTVVYRQILKYMG